MRSSRLLALAAVLALASCGGGSSDLASRSSTSPLAQRAPLAASPLWGVVPAQEAIDQLLDFAELSYAGVFTTHPATQSFGRYRFRYYPETGVFLAVALNVVAADHLVESGVYAMGGAFGTTPVYFGKLLSRFTPVVSQIAAAPTLSATYVANLPFTPKGMGVPCADRAAWGSAAGKITAITAQADALLGQPFPAWSDDDYLAWTRSGSLAGGTMMAARKAWLYPLVMAECASWQGKYLPALHATLRELATERTWTDSEQDRTLKAFNNGQFFMDLLSASMAHELAQTLYLMGDRLDAPTRQLVLNALEARVFAPVRKTLVDGTDGWWLNATMNWNAQILSGVVGAALTVIPSRHDRARFASMGQHYIVNFESEFPASGYGIEGPGYWVYGVKHLAALRQKLHEASGGQVDLLAAAKPLAISLYAPRMEMTPNGAVAPIGDTHIGVTIDPQTRNYLAAAYGNASQWPGAAQVRVNPWHMNDMPVVEASMLLTTPVVPVAYGFESSDFGWPGLRSYFSDVGILVTRSLTSEAVALAATIKSAGSANHGHDDVGSYTIALDGGTPTGEIGIGDYTSRTFSDQRRTIKWINSYGHPVPVVGGRLQQDGTTAVNTVVSTSFTDAADEIVIDMAPAYALPGGWSLLRKLRNDRVARSIAIEDDFSAFSSAQAFEVPITTLGTWTPLAADRLRITLGGESVEARIEASGAFTLVPETVTDDGLTFQRIAIRLTAAATSGWVRVTYTR